MARVLVKDVVTELSTDIDVVTIPGEVKTYAGATAPFGYLLCQGQAVSRTTYASLFAVLNEIHGAGDGLTTFNLPDYRGRFLRGTASGSAADPDRASRTHPITGAVIGDVVGSIQDMDWKGFYQTNTGQNTRTYSHNNVYMGKSTVAYTGNLFAGYWAAPGACTGTMWDTSEIRPKNASVNFIIKY